MTFLRALRAAGRQQQVKGHTKRMWAAQSSLQCIIVMADTRCPPTKVFSTSATSRGRMKTGGGQAHTCAVGLSLARAAGRVPLKGW